MTVGKGDAYVTAWLGIVATTGREESVGRAVPRGGSGGALHGKFMGVF